MYLNTALNIVFEYRIASNQLQLTTVGNLPSLAFETLKQRQTFFPSATSAFIAYISYCTLIATVILLYTTTWKKSWKNEKKTKSWKPKVESKKLKRKSWKQKVESWVLPIYYWMSGTVQIHCYWKCKGLSFSYKFERFRNKNCIYRWNKMENEFENSLTSSRLSLCLSGRLSVSTYRFC